MIFLHTNLVNNIPDINDPNINPAKTKDPKRPKKKSFIFKSYFNSYVHAGITP